MAKCNFHLDLARGRLTEQRGQLLVLGRRPGLVVGRRRARGPVEAEDVGDEVRRRLVRRLAVDVLVPGGEEAVAVRVRRHRQPFAHTHMTSTEMSTVDTVLRERHRDTEREQTQRAAIGVAEQCDVTS